MLLSVKEMLTAGDCRCGTMEVTRGGSCPYHFQKRKMRKKKRGKKLRKNEEKITKSKKLTKMTSMQFTKGSKQMSFEEVTLTPNFSEVRTLLPPPLKIPWHRTCVHLYWHLKYNLFETERFHLFLLRICL